MSAFKYIAVSFYLQLVLGLIIYVEVAFGTRGNVVEDIYLRYFGKSFDDFVEVPLPNSTELLKLQNFKGNKTIVFYIHGFEETPQMTSVEVIVKAYLEAQPETNIIVVDWSNMASPPYTLNAAPNTRRVAAMLAAELKKWIQESGVDLELIHIVGHSLGGQTAGFLGKNLNIFGIKLPRITALDPAFPAFYPNLGFGHLSAYDARFVDVIHTDAGGYGAPVSTGTVDFWPNGGRAKQPGCPRFTFIPLSADDLCSHWLSWRLWAESIRKPNAFPAAAADSYTLFRITPKKAKLNNFVYLGVNCNQSVRGNYYLETNNAEPYAKGFDGL